MQVVDIDDCAAGWPPQRVRQRLVLTVCNQDGWAAGGQRQRQPATMSFVSRPADLANAAGADEHQL